MNASLPIEFASHTGTENVCWAENPATIDSRLLGRLEDDARIREHSRLLCNASRRLITQSRRIATENVEMRRHVIQAGAHLAATRVASIIGRALREGRGSRIVPDPDCAEISHL